MQFLIAEGTNMNTASIDITTNSPTEEVNRYFSKEEFVYLSFIQSYDIETANALLLEKKKQDMKEKMSDLPKGAKTDKYISDMGKASAKNFTSELNKKLHTLAGLIRK